MKDINILMGLDQRFKLIEVREEGEGVKVIRVKWRKIEGRCPGCGKKATKVHQVYEKPRRVLHEVMGFRERVYVEYDRIRLRCRCGKVFTLLPEDVAPRIRVTKRMMDQILLLLRNSSFREVATLCGLSPKTVKSYLLKRVNTSVDWEHFRGESCVSISIDEHRRMRGKEVIMVVENIKGMPFALLPSTRKDDLKRFLMGIPDWIRVREFVIDMRRSYFYAIKEVFPGVPVVVDKFHVLRDAVRRLELLKRIAEDAIRRYEGRKETLPLYLLRRRYRDLTRRQRLRLRAFLERYPQAKLIQRVSCSLRNEEVYKRKVLLRVVPYDAFSHLLL